MITTTLTPPSNHWAEMNVAVARSGGGGAGVSAVVEYDYTAKEPDEIDLVKGAIIDNIKQMSGGWWEGTLQSNGKSGMFPDNFVRVVDANDDNAVTMRDKSATTNRRCKVIFSYTQVNDDELSLAVGDVIEFLGEVEEGWWRGRLKNKIGVFPSNFVTTIEPSPILASKRPPSQPATVAATSSLLSSSAKTKPTVAVTSTAAASSSSSSSSSSTSTSTKKMSRLSFHSSKEDLLSSTITAATTTASAPAVDDIAPILPPKPAREYCRVEFPYAPQNDDELELKVGDIITIINVELPDKGWWKGELRGKVGVFPDNFVKLYTDVSPLNETQHAAHRTAKSSNAGNSTTAVAATSSTTNNIASAAALSTSSVTTSNASSSATTSKVFIKKSGSTSSTQSSNRKDSFGSRDSLNDILSETGLPSGNVAAQRKSLENKNFDLTNAPDATTRLGLRKQQTQQQSNNTIITTTASSNLCSTMGGSELRKSLENMDEKVKTPPPVLTKKPTVPSKKSTTVTSVAGNILSGLKQKVKNVENKLTTTVSQDYADGVGSSKMSSGGLPDSGASGNVMMRRAATIAVEDSDFDRVERLSMLTDMRAGRVKAPKRRPPSAAINVIGESNNNDSIYLNGSNGSGSGGDLQQSDGEMGGKPHSSDEGEQLAKPKPREWETKKAPWMAELKASQVKKKTSPNIEPRMLTSSGASSVAERTSKLLGDDIKITSSNSSNNTSAATSSVISSSSTIAASSNSTSSATKVQSSTISSSNMQQSVTVESSTSNQSMLKSKEFSIATSATDAIMSKSTNSKMVNDALLSCSTSSSVIEDVRTRPNSLSIRNRSISPGATLKTSASPATVHLSETTAVTSSSNNSASSKSAVSSSTAKTTLLNNNHHNSNSSTTTTSTKQENKVPVVGKTIASSASVSGDSLRVHELERRVGKLEAVVHAQQRTIDELVRTLREETDRVKLLRGELDKYAQCVTQV